jgi:hypothetical protein
MFFDVPVPHTQNTGVIIKGFDHAWEVHVPLTCLEYKPTPLPPPYEAYGSMANFILNECSQAHKGTCRDYTLSLATRQSEKVSNVFANYNTVFGIARNKRDALNTKKKRAAKEESSESEVELVSDDDDDEEDEEGDQEGEAEDQGDEADQGDHGDQGDQGDQNDNGDQGDQGDQNDNVDQDESEED